MERGESVTDLFRQTFVVLSQSFLEQTRVQERYNFVSKAFHRFSYTVRCSIEIDHTFNLYF